MSSLLLHAAVNSVTVNILMHIFATFVITSIICVFTFFTHVPYHPPEWPILFPEGSPSSSPLALHLLSLDAIPLALMFSPVTWEDLVFYLLSLRICTGYLLSQVPQILEV